MSSLYYNLVQLAPAVMELMTELVENDNTAHDTFNMDLIVCNVVICMFNSMD